MHSISWMYYVRAALLCVSCDLPAARKALGFASYSSHYGCSKCTTYFPSLGSMKKLDYSDFDWQKWVPRDMASHRKSADSYLQCKTKSKMNKHISEGGVRYCPLLKLGYFDCIRFHVVDPMHNLLLGTAKHVLETWIDNNVLTRQGLKLVQSVVESLHAPVDVGRIPLKIASNFGGFKADQWRSWTTLFSAVALKGVIPDQQTCTILCSRVIRRQDITTAHNYLAAFCRTFSQLYGAEFCRPNQHMHIHLRDSIFDYGPSYSFWCFSFERYNGILGNYQTNNRNIGSQIMRKFIREQQVRSTSMNVQGMSQDISDLFLKMDCMANSSSLCTYSVSCQMYSQLSTLKHAPLSSLLDFRCISAQNISLLPPVTEHILQADTLKLLRALVLQISSYSKHQPFLHLCCRASKACVAGELIGSMLCKSGCSSCIAALWPLPSVYSSYQPDFNVGIVQYFIEYTVSVSSTENHRYVFAYVSWFKEHVNRNWFGSSVIVSSLCHHSQTMYSFIPVQRISNRCTHGSIEVNFGTRTEVVSVAVPIDNKSSLKF